MHAWPRYDQVVDAVHQSTNGRSVLIACTDPVTREEISAELRQDGFDVLVAADGVDALLFLESPANRRRVDLAVADLQLAGVTGLSLADRGLLGEIPIILFGRWPSYACRQAADARQTAAAVFEYPFELADLRTAVQWLVRTRKENRDGC